MQSHRHDGCNFGKVAKQAKRMNVQMRSTNFQPSDLFSIMSFLQNYRTACDSNGIHEGAGMWIFQHFVKASAKAAPVQIVCATKKDDSEQQGKLTTYHQVVNYLHSIYAIRNVITEIGAEIPKFKQPEGMSAVHYSEKLSEKALRCARLYDETRPKRVFIERLHKSIRLWMRTYCSLHKTLTPQSLEGYVTSLEKLQDEKRVAALTATIMVTSKNRQKQLITYTRWEKVTPALSTEERRGSVSTSSSSGREALKRAKRRTSRILSRWRHQNNLLDIASVVTQVSKPASYSNPSPKEHHRRLLSLLFRLLTRVESMPLPSTKRSSRPTSEKRLQQDKEVWKEPVWLYEKT